MKKAVRDRARPGRETVDGFDFLRRLDPRQVRRVFSTRGKSRPLDRGAPLSFVRRWKKSKQCQGGAAFAAYKCRIEAEKYAILTELDWACDLAGNLLPRTESDSGISESNRLRVAFSAVFARVERCR